MSALPPAIFFINWDISLPATPPPCPPDLPYFIGSIPTNPNSYIASPSELDTIQTQLFINDTMTKQEFDARVKVDPSYPTIVHLRGLRILVILPTFQDGWNNQHADVVMFLHQGLADIESNRFWDHWDDDFHNDCSECEKGEEHYDGYHRRIHVRHPFKFQHQSVDIQRITASSLLRAAHSKGSVCLPFDAGPRCGECNSPFYCDKCHTFSGIRTCFGCQCDCMCGCGIIDNQGLRISSVHLKNCDNEYNNPAFIHRK